MTSTGISKKQIAVLFGGRSVEHEISIISALEMISALDTSRYEIIPVYIAHSGRWFTGKELLDKTFYRKLPDALQKLTEVTLAPIPDAGGLMVLSGGKTDLRRLMTGAMQTIPVDVYFPVFHGQYGEDGSIQGLFEMAQVPYVSGGVMSTSVAMNKVACKKIAGAYGIPVLPGVLIEKHEAVGDLAAARRKVMATPGLESYPLFIKPNNLGSSIGVSRAHNEADLGVGLAKVFKFDTQALVEPCITSLFEINVSVCDADEPVASVVEIPVSSDGVLTFEDKYMRGGKGKKGGGGGQGMASLSRAIDPENLPTEMKEKVRSYATTAFKALGCSGVSRFDFIVDTTTDSVYFNELNSIPGSLAHYLWAKSHPPVLYTQLLDRMIARAEELMLRKASLERDTGFKALFQG